MPERGGLCIVIALNLIFFNDYFLLYYKKVLFSIQIYRKLFINRTEFLSLSWDNFREKTILIFKN